MKNINSKFVIGITAAVLAMVVTFAIPGSAHAEYAYYNGYGTTYGRVNYDGAYGYNRVSRPVYNPAPVVVSQPVYVQQPVVTQPVYVQQPVVYQQPVYYSAPTVYYNNLSVSCSANTSYVNGSGYVTWTAYATGGNGYYSWSWSGSDGLYGTGQNAYINYTNSGTKYAYVTVYSNGQTITQACSNSVNVSGYSYNYPVVYQQPVYQVYPTNYVTSNYNGLDIGCYSDPTNATIDQPVTWTVEVTGGVGPYSYSWTGSEGLTGSQSSIIKYYGTSGSKSAIVTVTSADGKTGIHSCSNQVKVSSASSGYTKTAKTQTPKPVAVAPSTVNTVDNTQLPASALFSLAYVPWGWVAVLIILILFFTVIYMLFNRQKI